MDGGVFTTRWAARIVISGAMGPSSRKYMLGVPQSHSELDPLKGDPYRFS